MQLLLDGEDGDKSIEACDLRRMRQDFKAVSEWV